MAGKSKTTSQNQITLVANIVFLAELNHVTLEQRRISYKIDLSLLYRKLLFKTNEHSASEPQFLIAWGVLFLPVLRSFPACSALSAVNVLSQRGQGEIE